MRGAHLVGGACQVKPWPPARFSRLCSQTGKFEAPLGRSCQFVHGEVMDRTDLKILAILQEDSSLPVAEVASRVNLSQTPCWRRIQKLEAQGVIARRVAILDPESVGLGI